MMENFPPITLLCANDMKTKKTSVRNILFRIIGTVLGLGLVFSGIQLFLFPIYDTWLEKLNIVSFFLIGIVFLAYGVSGKIILRFLRKKKP